jgi:putative hydrolase of the HAD superfamily
LIVAFDLDDFSYVMSGFKEISQFIEKYKGISANDVFENMMQIYIEKGRGQIFDEFLKDRKIYSIKLVKNLISIYRKHIPNIRLNQEDLSIIKNLSFKYSLYLVTDGNKMVQDIKIKKLGLETYFEKVYITHRYGIHSAKPSMNCFNKILLREKTTWENLIYVGDDPNKDFVNLNKIGATTIRIRKGRFKTLTLSKDFEAKYEVENLKNLPKLLSVIESKFDNDV